MHIKTVVIKIKSKIQIIDTLLHFRERIKKFLLHQLLQDTIQIERIFLTHLKKNKRINNHDYNSYDTHLYQTGSLCPSF